MSTKLYVGNLGFAVTSSEPNRIFATIRLRGKCSGHRIVTQDAARALGLSKWHPKKEARAAIDGSPMVRCTKGAL